MGHERGEAEWVAAVCCYSAPPFVSALRVHVDQGREESAGGVGGGGNIN